MHIELFRDKNEKWGMRLKAGNGNVLMSSTSQAYNDRRALDDTLEGMAKWLGDGAARLTVVTEGGEKIESLADWSPRGE